MTQSVITRPRGVESLITGQATSGLQPLHG